MNVKIAMWVVGVWGVVMIGITIAGLIWNNQRNGQFYDQAINTAPTPACAIMWRCRSKSDDKHCESLSQACVESRIAPVVGEKRCKSINDYGHQHTT